MSSHFYSIKETIKPALFIGLTAFSHLLAETPNETAFTHIYENKIWGTNEFGEGFSGGGSTLQATKPYREYLQHFLESHGIRTVVDVGCGDWEFSKAINWDGIEYSGFDVVKSVVKKNREKYETPHIHFYHGDAVSTNLPSADLLICKDVLQHLPNEDVFQFLRQLSKFKYCLITNEVNPRTLSSDNRQIRRGDTRPVDLTIHPFNLKGTKVLTYQANHPGDIKQVLLIKLPGL